MSSIQDFAKIDRDAGVPKSLRGYCDQEVSDLESQYAVKLPPSFVAYLKLMGHGMDRLFLQNDAQWLRTIAGDRTIGFFGDADPADLLIFAWLRLQMPVSYVGVNDLCLFRNLAPAWKTS